MLFSITLLFAVSTALDCNSLTYTDSLGAINVVPTDECTNALGLGSIYRCNDDGTVTYQYYESSNTCEGNATLTTNDFCSLYTDCEAVCGMEACPLVTFETFLDNEGCSGDPSSSISYIKDVCTDSEYYTCSGGKIKETTYSTDDCSGSGTEFEYNIGCVGGGGASIRYSGCTSNANNLKIIGVIIVVFIASFFE